MKYNSRTECIHILQNVMVGANLDGWGLDLVWEYLKKPMTLVDFLAWEEGEDYKYKEGTYRVIGSKLFIKIDKLNTWKEVSDEEVRIGELERLAKESTKVDYKKYYLKHKYLAPDSNFLNYNWEDDYYTTGDKTEKQGCITKFTMVEIEKIGRLGFDLKNFDKITIAED